MPFQSEFHFLGTVAWQLVQVEGNQSVAHHTVLVALGIMPQLQFKGIFGIASCEQVDKVGCVVCAPFGADAQGQVAVFGNGHPVLYQFDGVVPVAGVILFPHVCYGQFGTDAVNPVYMDFLEVQILLDMKNAFVPLEAEHLTDQNSPKLHQRKHH